MMETVGIDRSIDMSRAREYVKAIAVSGFTAMNVQRPNYRNDKYYPNIDPVVKFYNTYAARAVAFIKVEAERTLKLMDAGDEDALKNFLDGGRRLGIRTDCEPTLSGEIIFYLQNPECTRVMNDFTNYLGMVDRIHRLYCELFMYKCGMIS